MDDGLISTDTDAERAHKIGHKTSRSPRIEIITRNDRRRRWTLEQKREIVSESLEPGLTPTAVARRHGISSGQLYTWRQQVRGGQLTMLSRTTPDFAQVEMPPVSEPLEASDEKSSTPTRPPRRMGLIEIVLTSGVTLRVDNAVDAAALGRVLATLDRR